MKKKFIFMMLPLTMLINSLSVCANEYSEGTTASCAISATVESTYTVSIPATLTLTHTEDMEANVFQGTYTVGAKGNITNHQAVKITPTDATWEASNSTYEKTIQLTGVVHTDVQKNAKVTQAQILFENAGDLDKQANSATLGTTEFSNITGIVKATLTQADSYRGTLSFTYGIVDTTTP